MWDRAAVREKGERGGAGLSSWATRWAGARGKKRGRAGCAAWADFGREQGEGEFLFFFHFYFIPKAI